MRTTAVTSFTVNEAACSVFKKDVATNKTASALSFDTVNIKLCSRTVAGYISKVLLKHKMTNLPKYFRLFACIKISSTPEANPLAFLKSKKVSVFT